MCCGCKHSFFSSSIASIRYLRSFRCQRRTDSTTNERKLKKSEEVVLRFSRKEETRHITSITAITISSMPRCTYTPVLCVFELLRIRQSSSPLSTSTATPILLRLLIEFDRESLIMIQESIHHQTHRRRELRCFWSSSLTTPPLLSSSLSSFQFFISQQKQQQEEEKNLSSLMNIHTHIYTPHT